LLVALALLARPLGVGAQDGEAGAVVQRFVRALNAKDLDDALANFTEDALYAGGVGKEFVRGRLVRDFAVNRRIEITELVVTGNRVTWSWRSFEDPYQRLPGVPPIEGIDVAVVENGKIASNTGAVDPRSTQRQQAAVPAAVATRTAQLTAEATREAFATQVASSGLLERLPDTQGRRTPSAAPWLAAIALSLGVAVGFAALKRPEPAA